MCSILGTRTFWEELFDIVTSLFIMERQSHILGGGGRGRDLGERGEEVVRKQARTQSGRKRSIKLRNFENLLYMSY